MNPDGTIEKFKARQSQIHTHGIKDCLHFKLRAISEPSDNASENEKKKRQRRNNDEVMCHGHILNALLDRLFDYCKSFDLAKEIWKPLEYKYKVQEEGTNKFLIPEYNDFTMIDDILILHQFHECKDIANKICKLDAKLPESFHFGMTIAKLPPSWKD
ncbi:hypothetical protein RJ639_008803 [Escallonia herrerae]|uniref:Uncharacterized protein n=1 Tax=Escallonia herrerae TaxID=1293975 RepID=A0AA88VSN0_9ASTE|nr:hypothetical protein RJ639_008803 [Escallonia herrerae]